MVASSASFPIALSNTARALALTAAAGLVLRVADFLRAPAVRVGTAEPEGVAIAAVELAGAAIVVAKLAEGAAELACSVGLASS